MVLPLLHDSESKADLAITSLLTPLRGAIRDLQASVGQLFSVTSGIDSTTALQAALAFNSTSNTLPSILVDTIDILMCYVDVLIDV
jgi:hypothetical protein